MAPSRPHIRFNSPSCETTTSPSRVMCTSSSMQPHPSAAAARNDSMVFSGSAPLSPRCAITRGRGGAKKSVSSVSRTSVARRLENPLELPFNLAGELEVLVGHSAFAVRAAVEANARVVDRDVGMVIGGLGDPRDAIDELDSIHEFLELEQLADRLALVPPSGQQLELLCDLRGGLLGHRRFLPFSLWQ